MSEAESKLIFQRRFNELLRDNDITQKEIAQICEVSTSTVSTWSKGLNMPRMDKIERLANYFNLPKSYFIEDNSVLTNDELSNSHIGDRVRVLRESKGMTMKTLGEYLGVSESAISQYETGKRRINNAILLKLSNFFGVTVGYILGVEDEQKKPLVNDDEELTEYLDELRGRSEMRMLFSATKSATKEQIEAIVKMVESMKGDAGK